MANMIPVGVVPDHKTGRMRIRKLCSASTANELVEASLAEGGDLEVSRRQMKVLLMTGRAEVRANYRNERTGISYLKVRLRGCDFWLTSEVPTFSLLGSVRRYLSPKENRRFA